MQYPTLELDMGYKHAESMPCHYLNKKSVVRCLFSFETVRFRCKDSAKTLSLTMLLCAFGTLQVQRYEKYFHFTNNTRGVLQS